MSIQDKKAVEPVACVFVYGDKTTELCWADSSLEFDEHSDYAEVRGGVVSVTELVPSTRIDQLETELAAVRTGKEQALFVAATEMERLETELAEARKDAKSARAHLAWIAKNIQRPCYRHICDRNGIAEDALAILKRKRSPDDDELFALSEIDAAMEAK